MSHLQQVPTSLGRREHRKRSRGHRDHQRIAMIAPSRHCISPPFAGGLESLVWDLRTRLEADGHDVTLIAREGSDGVDPQWEIGGGRWAPSDLASRDQSMPAAEFMAEHHDYLQVMHRLAQIGHHHFDVIHNHSLHYLPVSLASTCEVPMLTTLHTPPTPWLESAISASRGPVGSFTAVSGFTARSWTALPQPATVIHNGVDLDWWRPGPGGDHLWWSGRITPEKAPHLAIDAARHAGYDLDFAGPISDPAYFRAEVRPRLGPGVRYLGHLAGAAQVEQVRTARAVLVTPTWDEPFGLVVIEALACGTPVVAFGRGGIPDILSSPEVGTLVPSGDTLAMGHAAVAAAGISRARVRQFAEQHFSLDRMTAAYVDLYATLTEPGLDRAVGP
ncbi:glycosyltransferase family 4 protein [Dermatophilaceae bacterium Sec6.4]